MIVKNKKQLEDVSGGESTFISVEAGETRVRIIGDIHCLKEHQNITVDGKKRAIACPTENIRMLIESGDMPANTEIPPCPLCERGFPVKTAFLAIAVDRKNQRAGVLKKGSTVFGKIQAMKDDPDWGDAGDYDVKILATGEGLGRKYDIIGVPVNRSEPVTEKESVALDKLSKATSLDKMTTPRSYEEIVKIIGENYPDYEAVKQNEQDTKNF